MYSKTYKTIGIWIMVLSIISAIILAFQKTTMLNDSVIDPHLITKTVFSWITFFSISAGGVITGFLFIGIGDIIETLLEIREKLPEKQK